MDRHKNGENDLFSREAYRRSKLVKQLDEQEDNYLDTDWSDTDDLIDIANEYDTPEAYEEYANYYYEHK